MTVTAFIFARGGSKGVPGKNIRPLAGRSLIARAVDCAKGVPAIQRVVLSTDDPALANEGARAGADVPFLRPVELAADDAPEWLAWRHALEACPETSLFVSVPPTAPLRAPADVSACLDRYAEGDVDIVITAMPAKRHPAFNMVRMDEEGHAALAQPLKKITRRQDAPALFDMTTVCYVADPAFVSTQMGIFEGRVGMVEVPEERALDIDNPLDWQIAEALIAAKEDAP